MRLTRRAWLGLGGGALAVLGTLAGIRVLAPGGFDAARWRALRHSASRDNPRAGMVGDLALLLRPGMTRAEVIALLGEPETQRDGRYTYALGASPYGADYEYYVIEFDGAGRLVRHLLMRG